MKTSNAKRKYVSLVLPLPIGGTVGQSCPPCALEEQAFAYGDPRDKEGIQCDDVVAKATTLTAGKSYFSESESCGNAKDVVQGGSHFMLSLLC